VTRRLAISIVIGILVITAAVVVIYQYEQNIKSKNKVTYANANQIQELKKKINELRHRRNQLATNQ